MATGDVEAQFIERSSSSKFLQKLEEILAK
jgi:hypothetical protein